MTLRCKNHLTFLFCIKLNMDCYALLASRTSKLKLFFGDSLSPSTLLRTREPRAWLEPGKLVRGALFCVLVGSCWVFACLSLCGPFEGGLPLPFTLSMGQDLCSAQQLDSHTEALLLLRCCEDQCADAFYSWPPTSNGGRHPQLPAHGNPALFKDWWGKNLQALHLWDHIA